MPLINCEISIILTWSDTCVTSSATRETKFAIADTKIYVLIVTLSTQDNAKVLEQLSSGFKRTTNWNKYQSKVSTERQNQYFNFLIYPSFRGVNRIFVLLFGNEDDRKVNTEYYLPKVEMKDYNFMIGGWNVFDQQVSIQKISTTQGDD